jgi:hypothetical protein
MISLFAGAGHEAKIQRLSDPLDLLSLHIDFAAIAAVIDGQLRLDTGGKGDSPAWPTQLMIRLPLSLQLYNLPDEALEYLVLDRRRF